MKQGSTYTHKYTHAHTYISVKEFIFTINFFSFFSTIIVDNFVYLVPILMFICCAIINLWYLGTEPRDEGKVIGSGEKTGFGNTPLEEGKYSQKRTLENPERKNPATRNQKRTDR